MRIKYLLLILVLLLIPSMGFGATYYVTTTGSGTTCSSETPCALQAGINKAVAGDTVSVAAGSYIDDFESYASGTSGNYITINGAGITTIIRSLHITYDYNKVSNVKFYGATTYSLIIDGNYNYIDTVLLYGWVSTCHYLRY